jgi:signal transduction histidine kinase
VKHARARHIAVRARIDAATTPVAMLELTVADDGVGAQSARPGRGLGNLRRRALALGGEFTLTREDERTIARLRVPLPATAPSDEPG